MNQFQAIPDFRDTGLQQHFTTLDLEQYRLGELSPTARRRIEDLLGRDAALARAFSEELARLDLEDRQFLARHPAPAPRPRLATPAPVQAGLPRIRASLPRAGDLWLSGLAGVAALVLLGFGLMVRPSGAADQGSDLTRLKGRLEAAQATAPGTVEFGLAVYRNQGTGPEALPPGSTVAANDNLQIAYRNPGYRHGTIFSVDGRHNITLHFPARASDDSRLAGPGLVLLPYAYCLDNAPGYENFLFVASDSPFDIQAVLEAVRQALEQSPDLALESVTARLRLAGASLHLASFPLRK